MCKQVIQTSGEQKNESRENPRWPHAVLPQAGHPTQERDHPRSVWGVCGSSVEAMEEAGRQKTRKTNRNQERAILKHL